ncbi:MAG: carboxypeptidase-like regulatory domain-containing protein [Planctomycetes bacterium]|nr:carboxypeptidase-like regulatory domain-containing protein [Planctomycetota bacterium]
MVRPFYAKGDAYWALEQAPVHADGSWGPVVLPRLTDGPYLFQLDCEAWAACDRYREPPESGEVVIDFETDRAVTVDVVAVDLQDHPVADADVTVYWNDEGWSAGRATTDAEGRATVKRCFPGTVRVSAQKTGFASQTAGPLDIPTADGSPVRVTCEPGGALVGHCTFRGEPLANFHVVAWRGDDPFSNAVHGEYLDRADGSFSLDPVPFGVVHAYAWSDDHPQSEVQTFAFAAGAPHEVDFELPGTRKARGRLIDGATREPAVGITVQLELFYLDAKFDVWGSAVTSDAEGNFEGLEVSTSPSLVRVQAPDYGMLHVRVPAGSDAVVELGDIVVNRTQTLTLRLTTNGATDFTRYELDLRGEQYFPLATFSAEGVVHLDGVAPGQWFANVFDGDDTVSSASLELRAGEAWEFSIPIGRGNPLRVELVPSPESKDVKLDAYTVIVASSDGKRVTRVSRMADAAGRADFFDALGTQAVIEVWDERGASVAAVRQQLDSDGSVVRIPIGDDATRLRVLDSKHQPVPGVIVHARDPIKDGLVSTRYTTDRAGECVLRGLTWPRVVLNLQHAVLGTKSGVAFDPVLERGRTLEVVFDAVARVRCRLVDRGVELAGVSCVVSDELSGVALPGHSSDPKGRVEWGPVAAGAYVLAVADAQCWPTEKRVDVRTADVAADVEVRRRGALQVRTVDGSDVPIANVALELRSDEFGVDISTWLDSGAVSSSTGRLTSDANGELLVQGLPNGSFQWRCIGAVGDNATGTIVVPPLGVGELVVRVH